MSIRTLRLLLYIVLFSVVFSLLAGAQDSANVPSNVVPQGTILLIQLTDRLDTGSVKRGDQFQARLAEPLTTADGSAVEAGRTIRGHVSAVEPGLQRRLLLSFDEMETPYGPVPLMATVTGVPSEHGLKQIGEEGEIGRKGMTKEQIAEAVIVGAGEGAVNGRRVAGKRGAAAGAGAGAADGALSAFESAHDLVLEKGTALEIRLDRNLMVSAR